MDSPEGAICPEKGRGAGLVMPSFDSFAMAEHLKEISAAVDPRCHAVLISDQAGWHTSQKLVVPGNITLLPLPSKAPELNPVENLWQFMRENWLSNRIFKSYDDIVDLCFEAWNKIIEQPWHNVHRTQAMGTSVLNRACWYERDLKSSPVRHDHDGRRRGVSPDFHR